MTDNFGPIELPVDIDDLSYYVPVSLHYISFNGWIYYLRTPKGYNPTHKTPFVDMVGSARTDPDGKASMRLTQFVGGVLDDFVKAAMPPISFVVTPISDTPVFMTTKITLVDGDDIFLDVFSWDHTGQPAPTAKFSWHVRFPWNREETPPVE